MKICKLKIATSIITSFVVAFAVIPYMGTANNVYAAGSSYAQALDVIDGDINGEISLGSTLSFDISDAKWEEIYDIFTTEALAWCVAASSGADGKLLKFVGIDDLEDPYNIPSSAIGKYVYLAACDSQDATLNLYSPAYDRARSEYIYVTPLTYSDMLESFRNNSVAGVKTMMFVDDATYDILYDEYELLWGYEGTTPIPFTYDNIEWHIVDKIPAAGKEPVIKEVISTTSFEPAAKHAGKYVTAVLVNSDGIGVIQSPYILITDQMADFTKVEWNGTKAYNYREQINSYPIFTSKVKDQSGRYLQKNGSIQEYTISYWPVDVIDEDEQYVYPGTYKAAVKFPSPDKTSHTTTWYIVPAKTTNMKANLRAKDGGYNDVHLSWKKPAGGCEGYGIWQKAGANASWKLIAHTKNTYYNLKDRSNGTTYSYKVKGYINTANGKKYSNTFSAAANVTTLKKVILKSTFSRKDGKVQVRWNNINGETGYQISKSTSKTGTNIVIKNYKTTTGAAYKVSATKGKRYYYKVRAYKVVNGNKVYGPWSAPKKFVR